MITWRTLVGAAYAVLTFAIASPAIAQEQLACGAALQRPLATGAVDVYGFAPDATATVVVEVTDTSGTIGLLKLRASGPDGVSETCSGELQIANPSGTTIEVSDCIGSDSGNYTITSNVVSPSTDYCARPLACGATADGIALSTLGEVDSYQLFPDDGASVTLTASDQSGSIGGVRLRVFDPQGALLPGGDSCSGSFSFPASHSVYTILASACDGPRKGNYRIVRASTDCPSGPIITSFALASADDVPLMPKTFDSAGRPVFARQSGRGFSVVVEARPGSDGSAVGNLASTNDPSALPDLQVLLSRPLGNGNPAVCDIVSPMLGGVPATAALDYLDTQPVTDAINDFGCRVDNGSGGHNARTSPLDACTTSNEGFGFGFVDASSTTQFCAFIQGPWPFPVGDTVVEARVRDHAGALSATREIVVRIGGPVPFQVAAVEPSNPVGVGSVLYFAATDELHGVELWRSDGTPAGTFMVADINPGAGSSSPRELTNLNGTLYFIADDSLNQARLWQSDGTSQGTMPIADIGDLPFETSLTNVDGTLFFFTGSNGSVNLWKSDGSAAGTAIVRPLALLASVVSSATSVDGTLFFVLADAADPGALGLWKSDGRPAGTTQVKRYDFSASSVSALDDLTDVNGTLFFVAGGDRSGGFGLWKSDGTSDGTVLVKSIVLGPSQSLPSELTNADGTLFFVADDAASGIELWKSNGTASGTGLVKDINPGSASSEPHDLVNVNGTLFFAADDGGTGFELWKSDGSAAGTVLVKDIRPGALGSNPSMLANGSGTLFCTAADGLNGVELWRSDGTDGGTVPVPGVAAGSPPDSFAVAGSTLFFRAAAALWTLQLTPVTPTCPGDCNLDGFVTVEELVRSVSIALGSAEVDECRSIDTDNNGVVTVDELVRAVNNALHGCG
ncbi:MAG TPA: ELWxxDGT repeat protein [Candidatus Kryptonia bacterium]|nr:ELWxxDGT repeat protein [Candidatus Kryptonia bacterium]